MNISGCEGDGLRAVTHQGEKDMGIKITCDDIIVIVTHQVDTEGTDWC
jgi:hypothetical protein